MSKKNIYLNKNYNNKLSGQSFTLFTKDKYELNEIVSVFLKHEKGYVIKKDDDTPLEKAFKYIAIGKYVVFQYEKLPVSTLLQFIKEKKKSIQRTLLLETGFVGDKAINALKEQISNVDIDFSTEEYLYINTFISCEYDKLGYKEVADISQIMPKRAYILNRNILNELIEMELMKF